jgi:hypothetical protein
MDIKILGGLSLETFSKENFMEQDAIQIQKKLYDSRQIAGVQLRVGHDFTNKGDIETLKQRVLSLEIPFIIHGPAENLGVDLGECLDENLIFSEYKTQNPNRSWKDFNLEALRNAETIAEKNKYLLNKNIIIHPGYAPKNKIHEGETRVVKTLQGLESMNFSLETVPTLAIQNHHQFFGIGSNVYSMRTLLNSRKALNVLIDFSHVLVSANQKSTSNPDYFLNLLSGFLELPVSNFTHFSGLTYEIEDEHPGFLADNKAAENNPRRQIIKEALKTLNKRYSQQGKSVYVALEIKFKDADSTRRQIDAFRKDYC